MAELILPPPPKRSVEAHKGVCGRVLVVAGSARYPGAAILAARGAGRTGAGLVHLALPAAILPAVLPAVPFCVIHACPSTDDGFLDERAAELLGERLGEVDATVLGPGLGHTPSTRALVRRLLVHRTEPVVLDADGLNALAHLGLPTLEERPGPTVLTPHPGEFARLSGAPAPQGDEARRRETEALARTSGAVVVLKGHHTVVSDGDRTRVEPAGNPGMATGGMGDVLAGMVGALTSVLDDAAGAAALAVHLHARAGDLAAMDLGQAAVLPGDVADRVGRVLAGMTNPG